MAAEQFSIPNAGKRCYLVGDGQQHIAIADTNNPLLFLIDLSTWPPQVEEIRDSYVQQVTWGSGGHRLVLDSLDLDDAGYDLRLHKPDGERLDCKRFEDERRYAMRAGVLVGEHIFAFPGHRSPYPKELPPAEVGPLLWAGGDWTEPEGADPVTFAPDVEILLGAVSLGDGSDILIWQGDGYRLAGSRLEKTFVLGAQGSRADWTWAPAGDDGFFYLSGRKLFEVHRGGEPQRLLVDAELDNIIRIAPGPGGSLLLRLGTNHLGAMGVVYGPETEKIQPLTTELLAQKRIEGLRWSEGAQRLIAVGKRELTSLSAEAVAALPSV